MDTNISVNASGISEFIPKKEPAPDSAQRVVVTVTKEDHAKLTALSKDASKAAGRYVSLGLVVNSLIKHYESFE